MIKVINTSGINGPATDFSSLFPSIIIDSSGYAIDIASIISNLAVPSYRSIDLNKVVTIPSNQNMLWTDELLVYGTIIINGRLVQI